MDSGCDVRRSGSKTIEHVERGRQFCASRYNNLLGFIIQSVNSSGSYGVTINK